MNNGNRPQIMTIDEAAKYLRIHKSTMYRLIKKKQIPAIKVGGRWRFRKDKIDSWLSRNENIV
jgi:excisionase family DNA binding protein